MVLRVRPWSSFHSIRPFALRPSSTPGAVESNVKSCVNLRNSPSAVRIPRSLRLDRRFDIGETGPRADDGPAGPIGFLDHAKSVGKSVGQKNANGEPSPWLRAHRYSRLWGGFERLVGSQVERSPLGWRN